MGSLVASGILTPGRPDPQNGVGQKSKIFDFAQNDFGDVSDNFPGKFFFVGKIFSEGLREFFENVRIGNKTFELPLRMIGLLIGISMVVILSHLIKNVRTAVILVAINAYIGPKLKYYAI